MNTIDKQIIESPGVQFAKAMLERKRQTQREIMEEYKDENSELRKRIENLKTRNEERGTPVIS